MYKDLLEKYNKLQNLRETEAEKLLSEYKAKAEKRFSSAEELIEKLKEQLKEGEQDEPVGIDNEAFEMMKKLSGMDINILAEHSYEISQSGRKGVLTYRLNYLRDSDEYEYLPLQHSSDLELPKYLQSEILFQTPQVSLFFWRILNFLNFEEKKSK